MVEQEVQEKKEDYFDMEEDLKETPIKKKHGCLKYLFIFLFIILAGAALGGYIKYYFVFGEGVKAGQLNYVVNKGYLFKTYEGKLIQTGIRSSETTANGIQSNEFVFSVEKKEVAEKLMRCGGQEVELHYKEYLGAIPWRGYSQFVVDSIISMNEPQRGETQIFKN